MAFFDLPLDHLRQYRPQVRRPDDLDAFWSTTLAEADAHPLDVRLTPVDTGFVLVDTFDLEFSGFGGDRIRGWLKLPHSALAGGFPAVVQFIGYGGGRGASPLEPSAWAQAGFAHLHHGHPRPGLGMAPTGDTPECLHGAADPRARRIHDPGHRDRDHHSTRLRLHGCGPWTLTPLL